MQKEQDGIHVPLHGGNGEHRLKFYVWRSLLTLVGPLLVVGFYAFVVKYYLQDAPMNNIILSNRADARWVFWAWFILAVLILDWARTGLANIEAALLMRPRTAPRSAAQLMWHADMKWSNVLWWVRYLRVVARWSKQKYLLRTTSPTDFPIPPNMLWVVSSVTTALLMAGIALSGLTIELSTIYSLSRSPSPIFGPNQTTFNRFANANLPRKINNNWQSGRTTSPHNGGYFYAPEGTANVTTTYFDKLATSNVSEIRVFLGPSVTEDVAGYAWGISANLSCRSIAVGDMKMLQVHEIGRYSINGCIQQPDFGYLNDTMVENCQTQWLDTRLNSTSIAWPAWLGDHITDQDPTLLAVADGASGRLASNLPTPTSPHETYTPVDLAKGPYCDPYNHDNWTFANLDREAARSDQTSAMFELFLWQQTNPEDTFDPPGSDILPYLSIWPNSIYDTGDRSSDRGRINRTPSIGFGIHCDIDTAMGSTELNPAYRTFSNFQKQPAQHIPFDAKNPQVVTIQNPNPQDYGYQVSPMQILAIGALSANQNSGAIARPLNPRDTNNEQRTPTEMDMCGALGLVDRILPHESAGYNDWSPRLSPYDVQHALCKLFGETLIAMMDDIYPDPWYGDLHGLVPSTSIVPGRVSWKPVMVLLSLWAAVLCAGALWLMTIAGPRWAPSLNGFELFKFGAQYAGEVNELDNLEFQECAPTLAKILGMVGVLPGNGTNSPRRDLIFIGLSENAVGVGGWRRQKIDTAFDRRVAAKVRPL